MQNVGDTFKVHYGRCASGVCLAVFLKTLSPDGPSDETAFFRQKISSKLPLKKLRVQNFFFSSPPFFHALSFSPFSFGASRVQNTGLFGRSFTQTTANFVRLIFKKSVRCTCTYIHALYFIAQLPIGGGGGGGALPPYIHEVKK